MSSASWRDAALRRPELAIVLTSLALRLLTSLVLVATFHLVPSFDASAAVLSPPVSPLFQPFVRWDTVYFVRIAQDGYTQEQRLAFMPGLPGIMRGGGVLLAWLKGADRTTQEDLVLAGMLASAAATTGAALALYRLTLLLLSSTPHALLTALLFLLAPARAVLHAVPYTEPFAAFFTFLGMLCFARGRHLLAALVWAAGTAFRAQGVVVGVGFFGWEFVLRRGWKGGRFSLRRLFTGILPFILLSALSAAPFFAFQAYAYRQFCTTPTSPLRPWCTKSLGLSYDWVQTHYWDVGPFRYWTLQQLPNFVLALPVFALSFAASYSYYSSNVLPVLRSTVPFIPLPSRSRAAEARPFLGESLVPYVHLHTATTLLLLVSSHVQIVLRVCATGPTVWWFAADLLLAGEAEREGEGEGEADTEKEKDKEKAEASRKKNDEGHEGRKEKEKEATRRTTRNRNEWGRRWVAHCVVWGTVAVVLWATFLPPA
ncbi:hypothetical protein JCM1840_003303 [Sporobolomyces johnsonii]